MSGPHHLSSNIRKCAKCGLSHIAELMVFNLECALICKPCAGIAERDELGRRLLELDEATEGERVSA